MLKKCLVLLLCLAVICVMPATAFAQTQDSSADEMSSVTITEDGYMIYQSDTEYVAQLLEASDEILSETTAELLDYFLHTPYVGQQLFCRSGPTPVDLSDHEAYQELISRNDLPAALEDYAESILQESSSECFKDVKFEALLTQPELQPILVAASIGNSHPSLSSFCSTSENIQASSGQLMMVLNNIGYYSSGITRTVNNKSVDVWVAHREWTAAEKTTVNNDTDMSGNTRIVEPSAIYNCHSYAWYLYATNNPYWIADITNFLAMPLVQK